MPRAPRPRPRSASRGVRRRRFRQQPPAPRRRPPSGRGAARLCRYPYRRAAAQAANSQSCIGTCSLNRFGAQPTGSAASASLPASFTHPAKPSSTGCAGRCAHRRALSCASSTLSLPGTRPIFTAADANAPSAFHAVRRLIFRLVRRRRRRSCAHSRYDGLWPLRQAAAGLVQPGVGERLRRACGFPPRLRSYA
jgi:hypothetical protein